MFPASAQQFTFGASSLSVWVPDPALVLKTYSNAKAAPAFTSFPFWSQIWPAAMGLCGFLSAHPHYLREKQVLELAAGLGLPSLLAARWAKKVVCSDLSPEAMEYARRSANLNGLSNFKACTLDWNSLPANLAPNVVLLSDINYAPEVFDTLFHVIWDLLRKGCTIILSTPQRLMAKPFVSRLLPWCIHQENETVEHAGNTTDISIYVLRTAY